MSKRSSRSDLKYGKYNQTTSRSRTTPETTPGQGAFTMGSRHIRRGRQRQPIPSVEIRHPCRRNIIHRQIHIQWTHNNIQQRKCQTRQEKSIFSSSTICANRPNATNVLRTPSTRRWQGPTRSSYSNIPYTIHKPITIRDRKKVSTQPHRYRPQHLHTPRRNIRNPRDLQRVQIKPRPTHYRSRRSQQTATTITRCIRIHHDSIHGRLTDRLHPRKNNRSERRFTPRRDHQSVLHPRTYLREAPPPHNISSRPSTTPTRAYHICHNQLPATTSIHRATPAYERNNTTANKTINTHLQIPYIPNGMPKPTLHIPASNQSNTHTSHQHPPHLQRPYPWKMHTQTLQISSPSALPQILSTNGPHTAKTRNPTKQTPKAPPTPRGHHEHIPSHINSPTLIQADLLQVPAFLVFRRNLPTNTRLQAKTKPVCHHKSCNEISRHATQKTPDELCHPHQPHTTQRQRPRPRHYHRDRRQHCTRFNRHNRQRIRLDTSLTKGSTANSAGDGPTKHCNTDAEYPTPKRRNKANKTPVFTARHRSTHCNATQPLSIYMLEHNSTTRHTTTPIACLIPSGTHQQTAILSDSGATFHNIQNRQLFHNYTPTKNQFAYDAGKQQHKVIGSGTVYITMNSTTENPIQFHLKAFHCPTLPNIINTTSLLTSGTFTSCGTTTGTTWTHSATQLTYVSPIRNGQEYFDTNIHINTEHNTTSEPNQLHMQTIDHTQDLTADQLLLSLTTHKLSASQAHTTRLRLAQLGVITIKNDRDKFFILHHTLGHRSIRATLRFAKEYDIPISTYARVACASCHLFQNAQTDHRQTHFTHQTHQPLHRQRI
eukprot:m.306137 g.306137  ORF g.306137 m.306137 type:complete len:826 (-) comp20191_c1_seq15:2930-5407(-)